MVRGGGATGWEGVGKMCVKENKRKIKRGGGTDKKGTGGILPDKLCANVCVNESSDYS